MMNTAIRNTLIYLLAFLCGHLCAADNTNPMDSDLKKRHLQYVEKYNQVGEVDVLWTRVADEYPPAKEYLDNIRVSLKQKLESELKDSSFRQIRINGIQDPGYLAFINFVHLCEHFTRQNDVCKMFLLMDKRSPTSANTVFRVIETTLIEAGYSNVYLKYIGSIKREFRRIRKLQELELEEFENISTIDPITQKELTDKTFLLRVRLLLKVAKTIESKQDFEYIYAESEKQVSPIRQALLSVELKPYSETVPYPNISDAVDGK